MSDTPHTITLDRDRAFYRVRVIPPCKPFDFDLKKRDGHCVRSYAKSLSRQRGWPLVDQTGEVAHG